MTVTPRLASTLKFHFPATQMGVRGSPFLVLKLDTSRGTNPSIRLPTQKVTKPFGGCICPPLEAAEQTPLEDLVPFTGSANWGYERNNYGSLADKEELHVIFPSS